MGWLAIDPTGELVFVGSRDLGRQKPTLRNVSTGEVVRSFDESSGNPGPGGKLFIGDAPGQQGVSLRNDGNRDLLALGIDQRIASNALFCTDGKHVAWGNADGSVMVADLDEIRSRLAQVGLSW